MVKGDVVGEQCLALFEKQSGIAIGQCRFIFIGVQAFVKCFRL